MKEEEIEENFKPKPKETRNQKKEMLVLKDQFCAQLKFTDGALIFSNSPINNFVKWDLKIYGAHLNTKHMHLLKAHAPYSWQEIS